MSPHDHEMLAAIADDLASDAPRLAYADALEERGDLRAAFIRLQINHRRPVVDGRPWRQMRALLSTHREAWMGELAKVTNGAKIDMKRGFLERAVVRFDDEHDGRRTQSSPVWWTLQRMLLRSPLNELALELLEDDSLRNLHTLKLASCEPAALNKLFLGKSGRRLKTLRIGMFEESVDELLGLLRNLLSCDCAIESVTLARREGELCFTRAAARQRTIRVYSRNAEAQVRLLGEAQGLAHAARGLGLA